MATGPVGHVIGTLKFGTLTMMISHTAYPTEAQCQMENDLIFDTFYRITVRYKHSYITRNKYDMLSTGTSYQHGKRCYIRCSTAAMTNFRRPWIDSNGFEIGSGHHEIFWVPII
jgi:hypothetical protein